MIGTTIVRAYQHAAGARGGQMFQALVRSCGGFSSKIHPKVDVLVRPLEFILTPGQAAEINSAEELIAGEFSHYLLADRGYDYDAFWKKLTERGITPVIPGKKNRLSKVEYDSYLYKERNFIERFFNRIKTFAVLTQGMTKLPPCLWRVLILTGILTSLKL